jgi:hypothetical protein
MTRIAVQSHSRDEARQRRDLSRQQPESRHQRPELPRQQPESPHQRPESPQERQEERCPSSAFGPVALPAVAAAVQCTGRKPERPPAKELPRILRNEFEGG